VYVLNVVDGCIPSDMATGTTAEIDEERRLLYVAMTRAKDDLHLVAPQRFFTHQQRPRGDRHVYAARTRFVPEIILDRFSAFTWPTSRPDDVHSPRGRHAVDLKARMRGRWS
jgi:DNA helicase-2/ATP-dependent DNA helicase PcrA